MTNNEASSLSGSGFEKHGGHASSDKPVTSLPKVPGGPAPGAPGNVRNEDGDRAADTA